MTDTRSDDGHFARPAGTEPAIAGVPSPSTKYWSPRRKAEVVAAVREGRLDLEVACDLYELTLEEFLDWENALDRHGLGGFETKQRNERRKAARRAVKEPGAIIINEAARLECVITNISSGGARLQVSVSAHLPSTFELQCVRSGRAARVSVAWQRRDSFGVRFETALPVPLLDESVQGVWLIGHDA